MCTWKQIRSMIFRQGSSYNSLCNKHGQKARNRNSHCLGVNQSVGHASQSSPPPLCTFLACFGATEPGATNNRHGCAGGRNPTSQIRGRWSQEKHTVYNNSPSPARARDFPIALLPVCTPPASGTSFVDLMTPYFNHRLFQPRDYSILGFVKMATLPRPASQSPPMSMQNRRFSKQVLSATCIHPKPLPRVS